MAWLYFVVLTPSSATEAPHPSLNQLTLAAYSIGKVLQFGLPIAWVYFSSPIRIGLVFSSWQGWRTGVLFGCLAGAAVLAAYYAFFRNSWILHDTPEAVRAKLLAFHAATPLRFFFLAVFLSGIHSLLEEYYWRWFLFGELERILALSLAVLISSLAFMGHHVIVLAVYFPGRFLAAALPFSLCVALGGAVWAWLFHRSQSLGTVWLSHLLVDVAILVVGYDMVFR
jgi:membrane protease YdiL (CAAX protease family)